MKRCRPWLSRTHLLNHVWCSVFISKGYREAAPCLCLETAEASKNLSCTVLRIRTKAHNDTEEGITMSAVPQCCVFLLWTKMLSVAQRLNVHECVHLVGIIIGVRGACTVYIISLITVPCSNYNAAGTHSTLRSLPMWNLYTASIVNQTHTQAQTQKKLVSSSLYLPFGNPICSPCSPYSCHSSFPHSSSALPWLFLTENSRKQHSSNGTTTYEIL